MRADDPITYEIDEQTRITAVNTAWFDEAQASGDERLSDSHLVGQSLWDLIRDQSTRHLYETLIAAARIHRDAVAFRFRCDTPDQRRLLRMQVTARPDGHVTFSVSLVASQLRDEVALLQAGRASSDEFVHMCGWCKRVRLPDDAWVEVEEAINQMRLFESAMPLPAITHGICPTCLAKMDALVAVLPGKEMSFGELPTP